MTEDLEERVERENISLREIGEGIYLAGSMAYEQIKSTVQVKYRAGKKKLIKKKEDLLVRRNYT